jgi:hypothetical protein
VEAYAEKMEPSPEEMKSVAVHEALPKEEVAVNTFGALQKQHGDWYLAIALC